MGFFKHGGGEVGFVLAVEAAPDCDPLFDDGCQGGAAKFEASCVAGEFSVGGSVTVGGGSWAGASLVGWA